MRKQFINKGLKNIHFADITVLSTLLVSTRFWNMSAGIFSQEHWWDVVKQSLDLEQQSNLSQRCWMRLKFGLRAGQSSSHPPQTGITKLKIKLGTNTEHLSFIEGKLSLREGYHKNKYSKWKQIKACRETLSDVYFYSPAIRYCFRNTVLCCLNVDWYKTRVYLYWNI